MSGHLCAWRWAVTEKEMKIWNLLGITFKFQNILIELFPTGYSPGETFLRHGGRDERGRQGSGRPGTGQARLRLRRQELGVVNRHNQSWVEGQVRLKHFVGERMFSELRAGLDF